MNDTTQTSLYSISFHDGEKYTGITAGNCNPNTTYLIGNYSLKEIDTIKAIHVQSVFYQKGVHVLKNAIDTQIKVTPVNLCKAGAYKHTRWFNSTSLLRPLDKESIVKEEGLETIPEQFLQKTPHKTEDTPHKETPKQSNSNIIEIDLHIDKLLDDTTGMENKDMLDYQMDVFHKTLEQTPPGPKDRVHTRQRRRGIKATYPLGTSNQIQTFQPSGRLFQAIWLRGHDGHDKIIKD